MTNTPNYECPWPLNAVAGMQSPPTAMDLLDVVKPLLAQCESLATSLTLALESGDRDGQDCQSFAPSARLLRDNLLLARQIVTAFLDAAMAERRRGPGAGE